MSQDASGIVRFGGFELDPTTGELWRDGEPVDLPPQPARLLALLARSPGRIVSRDRIREEVWSGTVVEFDQAINNAVRQVRDALGDDASDPRFIETVPRRGYRFIAPVEPVRADDGPAGRRAGEATPDDARSAGTAASRRSRRWSPGRLGALTAIAIGIAAAVWVGLDDDPPERGAVLAVVPARATTVGSPAEALADTLTTVLTAALSADGGEDLRVIPWTWDMGVDPGSGGAVRDGEAVDVDLLVEANVYQEPGGIEVSVTLTHLPGGTQVWHRRIDGLGGNPADAADRVADIVVSAVRDRVGRRSPDA
jgi:DNA-binding winged helix-turn-helix (wHTH) protein/TolB-like protein